MTTALSARPQLRHLTAQLDELKRKGTYFHLRVLNGVQEPVSVYDGKQVINLASNNYLGFCNHPKLREAAIQAIKDYGVGPGAVRTIAGTMKIHMELEEKIARFKNVEACVVFQSGFTANAGTVSSILGKDDFILSDELNHASIIDGARLSRAKIKVFRHKDVDHAEELLKEVANEPGRKLIITDGVFSMDGDIGPVDKLADLADKYGAIMMVDDAHASGVLGRNGRGSIDHFNCHGRVDIQVGTLSKAIGAIGGYVCGSKDLIDYLCHRARPFLFSTSHPPSVTATCIAAFDLLESEPERIERLWDNTRYFKGELGRLGFNIGGVTTPASETPITPIIIGDGRLTMDFSRALFDAGLMATGIAFPTVAEGKARIRTIMTSEHTRPQIDQALEILEKTAKKIGISG
ncbi:glycine C-acetyltransferase [Paracidobacterium acidisoli]|uniref:Glycine C-acetyltransferase n=1 Tax=Paracidobacterium acidisoli TaxID=2303751 RepID=A0A372IMU9_9BACT|nr:glycine C-acetyltransferase [Paracidobacterium acidisoli]MBT9331922.1 glycine C-acetyltransferase [Paracidobacterium acidisoli]